MPQLAGLLMNTAYMRAKSTVGAQAAARSGRPTHWAEHGQPMSHQPRRRRRRDVAGGEEAETRSGEGGGDATATPAGWPAEVASDGARGGRAGSPSRLAPGEQPNTRDRLPRARRREILRPHLLQRIYYISGGWRRQRSMGCAKRCGRHDRGRRLPNSVLNYMFCGKRSA